MCVTEADSGVYVILQGRLGSGNHPNARGSLAEDLAIFHRKEEEHHHHQLYLGGLEHYGEDKSVYRAFGLVVVA